MRNIRLIYVLLHIALLSYAAGPSGPIYLWDGYKVHSGKDVQMYVFRPDNPNGVGVVVCPGGSYYWLDKSGEGLDVGEWLSSQGITAFVLYYRTAGKAEFVIHGRTIFHGRRYPDMILDAQRALQYVWENSGEYCVDRGKIGMMGFSAGGHLVMSAACFHSTNFLKEIYGIDTDADLRPAFVVPVYPVVTMNGPYVHRRSRRGLLGDSRLASKAMKDSLSLENHIPDDCPPVFVVNCCDDPIVPYRNSMLLDSALTSKKIPHKYILYECGGHGFGVGDNGYECREWRDEFLYWLGQSVISL